MLRDVFYYGRKPNVHPKEKFATSLEDARSQATTQDFWIINEYCDYRNFDWNFDFEFLPDEDVWAEDHINIWPSPYQKDSGTWLCSTNPEALLIYRADVSPIPLKEEINKNWKILEPIDKSKFDFKWHPDPSDPPYIYVFGNQWYSGAIMPTIEYHVPGAINKKYILDKIAYLAQSPKLFTILHETNKFDFSWRPDPTSPPYIYVFGNTQYPGTVMPTIEFHVEGATERKYVNDIVPELASKPEDFEILEDIDMDKFDFSWVPDPTSPPYIYAWGNQWNNPQDKISVTYTVEGATEYKYMEERAVRNPCMENWRTPGHVVNASFDFSWEPNPNDPPYVYQFGTQWQKTHGPQYYIEGATELKYVDVQVAKVVCYQFLNWQLPMNIDQKAFDFSWHPDMTEEPYIYQFPSQWSRSGGPRFIVEGATEFKYVDVLTAKAKVDMTHWTIPEGCATEDFDFSWHPDIQDEPMLYQFGTQHQKTGGPIFTAVGCDETSPIKYVDIVKARALPTTENWVTHEDVIDFDYSWHPDSTEEPYIYQWGNKFYSSELKPTVEYIVPGATQIKHMSQDVKLAISDNWIEHYDIDKNKFDMSWRPDPTSPPYIYKWGNKHVPVEIKATLEYVVDGATEVKYVTDLLEVLPEFDRWNEIQSIDRKQFDLTWRPDPREPDYIYVWGNKWISAELKSTIEYRVPGATECKYMDEVVTVLAEQDRWVVTQEVIDFDMTWRPDPREPAYIYTWGNKHISAELKPTLEYYCPGATERKYMDNVDVVPEYERWVEYQPVDRTKFDMSWRPDPREPAYIYVWGNKWIAGELEPTIEYHCPGATEKKYMQEPAEVLPISERWKIIQNVENFDFSWRPDPREPDYIYVWGNKYIAAELQATIEYHCPNGTERKYMGEVDVAPEWDKWNLIIPVDKSSFDFKWRPDPREPAYIYVWGNKYNEAEREPTVEYHCAGATEIKYMYDKVATTLPDMQRWNILIPVESFDYSWRPDPKSPPYVYVFGNKWNDSATEPTLEYKVDGATDIKYVNDIVATPKAELQYWQISNNDDLETFDFSWRPNPHSPPQIYQWADNGPRYTMSEATEVVFMERTEETIRHIVKRYKIKTTLEDLINEHTDEVFWAINPDLSYEKFDFSWRPNEENFRHVNVFGNEYSMNTQTYYVNAPLYMMGHKEFNYVEGQTVEIDSNLSMFFVDRGNSESSERFIELKTRYPQLQKTRYLNSWVDTINRCITKSVTNLCWIVNSELDYTQFDFDFYPSPWQMKMVHVFGTQWSHWGTTFMVNKEAFPEDTKYVKIIEHLNTLNFVKRKVASATNCLYDIVLVDHGNIESESVSQLLTDKTGKTPITVKFSKSYLQTFSQYLKDVTPKKEHYIWVCSSICDYINFDFSYICDPYAKDQLHVFPSDKQKFGDTFLVDVNKFHALLDDMLRLEDYEKVNYNQHQRVKRLPSPIVIVEEDTQVELNKYDFAFPYAEFVTPDNKHLLDKTDDEPMSIWAPDHRNIIVKATGGTRVTVPKDAKDYIDRELYDYPYISRSKKLWQSNPLDIIFLSNGETCADANYEHLLKATKGLANRVIRLDGINGRVKSQHTAADTAITPWYFLVNGKLKVNTTFDWNWQPDRLQVPKHYIFNATNPVNGLEYGHQAIVANNKRLTLDTKGTGLDFTLDSEHEVVMLNCGVATYNTSAWDTWRTAFREVIKLRHSGTDENKERLNVWLKIAVGDFADYSRKGASDAMHYYDMVGGDFAKLKLSYDWAWLRSIYEQSVDL
jgi:hypothetical protein